MTPEQLKNLNRRGRILLYACISMIITAFLAYKATDNPVVGFAVMAGILSIFFFVASITEALEASLLDRLDKSE